MSERTMTPEVRKALLSRYPHVSRAMRLAHHTLCDFAAIKVCTCGLLADLSSWPNQSEELYPKYPSDLKTQRAAVSFLTGFFQLIKGDKGPVA